MNFQPVRVGESHADTVIANPDSPYVLIACCAKKSDYAARAEDLYQSELFLKSKAWAELFGISWHILSAKHGVIPPGRVIKPYDESLNSKSASEIVAWNKLVRSQMGPLDIKRPTVVLAGSNYRGWIQPSDNVLVPMQGLGIGSQLAWLKNQVNTHKVDLLESIHDNDAAEDVDTFDPTEWDCLPAWQGREVATGFAVEVPRG